MSMTMINNVEVETSIVEGNIWFKFVSRGVDYSISKDTVYKDRDFYNVWSHRKSGAKHPTSALLTSSEIRKRSKLLKSVMEHIELRLGKKSIINNRVYH